MSQRWVKFIQYPFYDWDHWQYKHFMISLLRDLEPRYFDANQTIFRELEEATEFYFVQKGKYDIGYEVNKVRKYRL